MPVISVCGYTEKHSLPGNPVAKPGWEPGRQSLNSFLSAIKLYPVKSTALKHPIYRDYILLSYRQFWDTPPNLRLDPAFSFLCPLIAPSSTSSPFLHVNTQYLQILSTQDYQEPYLSGSQESSHFSKTQRVQHEPRGKTPTQQTRTDQHLDSQPSQAQSSGTSTKHKQQ